MTCRPGGPTGSEWGFAVEFEGRYAGTISLRDEGPGRAEIAYGSHPDVRGTGAMLRALRLLVDWGFAELDLETIVWQAFTGNWASRKAGLAARLHGRGHAAPLPARSAVRGATRGSARCSRTTRASRGRPGSTCRCSRATGSGCGRSGATTRRGSTRAPRSRTPSAGSGTSRRRTPSTTRSDYVEKRRELEATGQCVTWAIADPGRRPAARHDPVVQLDARSRVRDRLLDPPGGARARPVTAKRPGW